jgi:AraC family transcriptional regulator
LFIVFFSGKIPAMNYRIESVPKKKLVGMKLTMSLMNNKTGELWRSFMQRRKEITNAKGTALYSMQFYDASYFKEFNPQNEFVKYAATEVNDFLSVPDGFETVELPSGDYAVFLHRGPASAGAKTFQHIFGTWLPSSDFVLDNRPHFELLGDKYKNNDPDSEEEFFIPIKRKS